MIVLGLTGSIGMGKSTTAEMFSDARVPVWDADAAVHKLYGPSGVGADAISDLVPYAVSPSGVDRTALRAAIMLDDTLLKKIEDEIHPLVAKDRADFLNNARAAGATLVVCDIPLLFETGAEQWLDKVVVVTASADIQRKRVLARPDMTSDAFEAILAKQVPDAVKREKADFLIDTGLGMDHARTRVDEIIEAVGGEQYA
jgi:dephospho-CoA kinase